MRYSQAENPAERDGWWKSSLSYRQSRHWRSYKSIGAASTSGIVGIRKRATVVLRSRSHIQGGSGTRYQVRRKNPAWRDRYSLRAPGTVTQAVSLFYH